MKKTNKSKCMVCEKPATITKEVLIALSYITTARFKSTGKMLDFCNTCFPHVKPVIICN
jgi:hypothetical protein